MNPVIFFTFVALTFLTFVIVVVVIRPTAEQKAVSKRIIAIRTKQGDFAAVEDTDIRLKEDLGSFQWLEELFEASEFSKRLQILIVQADRTTSVGTVMMTSLVLGTVTFLLSYLFSRLLVVAIPAALLLGYGPFLVLKFMRSRRLTKFDSVLADCIDMMSRSLRAGHSVVGAIGMIAEQAQAPANFEFGEVFKKQNYGLPLREALLEMLDRVPSQDLRVLVTGILVQKDTGGNLVDILERIAQVIRERVRIKGEIRTHTAQGRMTGWILCALPIVMLVIINFVNPGYSNILFHDPFGQKVLGVGAFLLLAGGLIIRQIINGIEV